MDFTAAWAWPQWTFFILMLLTLIGHASNHGKERPNYNGFIALINFGLMMFILIAGGFFA